MEYSTEELAEPVSPTGQCFDGNLLSPLYILAVLEFEVPIHDLQIVSLVQDAFLSIPRLTSIMVRDEKGVKRWKRVQVNLEEHIIQPPMFYDGMSMDSYDKYFSDYLSRMAMEQLPRTRPLWQVHVIKYPTSNASGTLVFKFDHAIGDGYTLMGLLLSSLQRADDPSLPLSFPSRKSSSNKPEYGYNNYKWFVQRLPQLLSLAFSSVSDFGWSLLKSTLVEDDKTPIRSGVEAVEFQRATISNTIFSLDHIKEIKSNLEVTINDVITGIIFYGIRLYMQDIDYRSTTSNSTALAMMNTRNVEGYRTVKHLLKTNAEGYWGNHVTYLHVSIPKLKDTPISNPLQFVRIAHNEIKRKRYSLATPLIGMFLHMQHKLGGPKALAKYHHRASRNSSLLISNMVGPVEQMALANHPIKGLYFTVFGMPQSLVITIMSYMGMLRVTTATEEGFIDEQKLACYVNNAFEIIRREAAKENILKMNKF